MKLPLVLSCAFVIGAAAKSGEQKVQDLLRRTDKLLKKVENGFKRQASKKYISNPKKKLVETAHPYLKEAWSKTGKLTPEDISKATQIPFKKPAVATVATTHQHTSRVGEWIDGASFV